MTQREATWEACAGLCVGCRKAQPRHASSWVWNAHHVLRQQVLRRLGVKPARIRDATYTVVLCWTCHGGQESAMHRVPLERLPAHVVEAVDALGTAAEDILRRYHPAAAA